MEAGLHRNSPHPVSGRVDCPSSPARTVRVHRASTAVSGVADAGKASIDLDFAGGQNPCQA